MLLPYRYKNDRKKLVVSLFAAVLLFPVLAGQIIASWRHATRMLKEGAKIERF
jgi:hypothetical protein